MKTQTPPDTIAPETVVYDIKGNAASVSIKHPTASGYLVHPLYEYHDNECGPSTEFGELTHWPQVYLSPPTEKKNAEIEKLDAKLAEQRAELAKIQSARFAIQRTEKEDKLRLEKLSMRSRALTRLENFLDGKITHYVKTHHWDRRKKHYSSLAIVEVGDEKCSSDEEKSPLRLLTLCGSEPNNLEFYLNDYRDGSGAGWNVVFPCCSLEEAMEKAKEIAMEQLDEWRGGQASSLHHVINNFPVCGLDVPKDAEDAHKEYILSHHQRVVEAAKQTLLKAEQELESAQLGSL